MEQVQLGEAFIQSHFSHQNYRLIQKISQGGFGQVYQALQQSTGQLVAIKFLSLNPAMDDAQKQRYIERFDRETQLGSRLQHPNIVRLLDKGQCDDVLLYAVFEFVEGCTLKSYLQNHGPMAPSIAAQIMSQVLEALGFSHQLGIIHRDIKPANIMVIPLGNRLHVKVLDFGIGTLTQDARQQDYKTLTLTQETLGTPSYSAPEQLRGEPATTKTDLYVWGLVFIECLTGLPAVSASSIAAIFHKQLSPSNVPLPPAIIGHPLAGLLRSVLNKKLDERADSALALHRQLGALNLSNLVGKLMPVSDHAVDNAMDDTQSQTMIAEHGLTGSPSSERRQLTVLCLLLDVQGLSDQQLSLEVADTLHQDQLNQCQDIALKFGAYHVGTLGNMQLFYFGYPKVTDNDSRLAGRTVLEVISEINRCNIQLRRQHNFQFTLKAGFHVGMVSCYADSTPSGHIVNQAIALAQAAPDGQVLCSEALKHSLNRHMEFQTSSKAHQYRLTGERQTEACGFVLAKRSEVGLVGRLGQLEQLTTLLAQQSNVSSLHLCGEAGIGKSRLTFELLDHAGQFEQYLVQCLPEQQNSALFPLSTLLRYQYQLDQCSAQQGMEKLKQALFDSQQQSRSKHLALLFSWLGWPLTDDMTIDDMPPAAQRLRLFELLLVLLCRQNALAPGKNRLFVFEDLHWADPMTLDFIEFMLKQPVFAQGNARLLSTSRQPLPQQLAPLFGGSLSLGKLDETASQQFIERLFAPHPISSSLGRLILSRTDGIPLFIEQLSQMLKQQNLVQLINGQYALSNPQQGDALPVTLRDSLQQKLDALNFGKETVQLCSAIGRTFDRILLKKVTAQSDEQLQLDIDHLLRQDIIYKLRKVSGDHYVFRHALIKDVAYDSIRSVDREKVHLRLAMAIENSNHPIAEQSPHILANHWAQAKHSSHAARWYFTSGEKAKTRFANDETIFYCCETVKHLQQVKQNHGLTAEQTKQLVLAFEGCGDAQQANGEHQKAREAYSRGLDYCNNDDLKQAQLHYKTGLSWGFNHQHHKALLAYTQAKSCIDVPAMHSEMNSEHWWSIWFDINSARLNIYYWLNDIGNMASLIDAAAGLVDKHGNRRQKADFINDQLLLAMRRQRFVTTAEQVAMAHRALRLIIDEGDPAVKLKFALITGLVLYCNGRYLDCHTQMSEAFELAQKINNLPMQTLCGTYLTLTLRHENEVSMTAEYAGKTLKISEQTAMADYIAAAKANLAWVALRQGDNERSAMLADESLNLWQQQDVAVPYPLQWLALFVQLEITLSAKGYGAGDIHRHQADIVAKLLDDKQQKLPEKMTDCLRQYNNSELTQTQQQKHSMVVAIVEQAKRLGFL